MSVRRYSISQNMAFTALDKEEYVLYDDYKQLQSRLAESEKYWQHLPDCQLLLRGGFRCTCGLSELKEK